MYWIRKDKFLNLILFIFIILVLLLFKITYVAYIIHNWTELLYKHEINKNKQNY